MDTNQFKAVIIKSHRKNVQKHFLKWLIHILVRLQMKSDLTVLNMIIVLLTTENDSLASIVLQGYDYIAEQHIYLQD